MRWISTLNSSMTLAQAKSIELILKLRVQCFAVELATES